MKITRNSLKELIRQSIDELKEGGPGSGKPKTGVDKGMSDDEKEYHKSGQFDKDSERDDTGKDDVPYSDDEDEGGWEDDTGKKSWKESVSRKTTVKEVKKWFKTLEENRYNRTYASDARRVSWLVNNNLAEDYNAMPISMQKKWPKAAYKRERFLAKEFVKHLQGETRLKESIRKIVGGLITEVRYQEISISLDDFDKVRSLLKPKTKQIVKHPYSQKTFGLKVDKKQYDKVLELLMKKRIDVQG